MGILDYILLVCFIPAVIEGLWKGLIRQVFGIVAIVAGVIVASHFTPELAKWLTLQFENPEAKFVNILSFALLLIGTVLTLNIVGNLVTKLFQAASLGMLNRLLGMLFGLIKTALIMALLVYIFDGLNGKWNFVEGATLDASPVYTWLRGLSLKVFPFLKNLAENIHV